MALSEQDVAEATQEAMDPDNMDLENADFGDNIEDEAPEVEAQAAEPQEEQTDGEEVQGEEAPAEEVKAEEAQEEAPEQEAEREPRIPKSRLDRALARAREAEERLKTLEQEKKETKASPEQRDYDAEINDLSQKHAEALLDGKKEDAAAFNAQMMQVMREQTKAEMDTSSLNVADMTREAVVVDALIDDLISNNPVFQEDSEEFDQKTVDDIEELRELYAMRGYKASDALMKAVEVRFPQALEKTKTAAPAKDTKAGQKLAAKIAKVQNAAPDMTATGEDADTYGKKATLDAAKMTKLEDWDNLSDNEWDDLLGNHG